MPPPLKLFVNTPSSVSSADIDAIVKPEPLHVLNTPQERARQADKLLDRAHAANREGAFEEAASLFFSAVRLQPGRTSSLLSHINMRLKMGEAQLAVACYQRLLETVDLTDREWEHVRSRLREANQGVVETSTTRAAAVGIQRFARGRSARAHVVQRRRRHSAAGVMRRSVLRWLHRIGRGVAPLITWVVVLRFPPCKSHLEDRPTAKPDAEPDYDWVGVTVLASWSAAQSPGLSLASLAPFAALSLPTSDPPHLAGALHFVVTTRLAEQVHGCALSFAEAQRGSGVERPPVPSLAPREVLVLLGRWRTNGVESLAVACLPSSLCPGTPCLASVCRLILSAPCQLPARPSRLSPLSTLPAVSSVHGLETGLGWAGLG